MIPKKNNNLSKIRNNIDNKNIKANQKKSNSDLYNLEKFEYIPLKYNKYEKENNLENYENNEFKNNIIPQRDENDFFTFNNSITSEQNLNKNSMIDSIENIDNNNIILEANNQENNI